MWRLSLRPRVRPPTSTEVPGEHALWRKALHEIRTEVAVGWKKDITLLGVSSTARTNGFMARPGIDAADDATSR